jgi:glycine/serine hydroxymethyltransferase
MKEEEMKKIAEMIMKSVENHKDPSALNNLKKEVQELAEKYPLISPNVE